METDKIVKEKVRFYICLFNYILFMSMQAGFVGEVKDLEKAIDDLRMKKSEVENRLAKANASEKEMRTRGVLILINVCTKIATCFFI